MFFFAKKYSFIQNSFRELWSHGEHVKKRNGQFRGKKNEMS